MTASPGWVGKILRVNMSDRSVSYFSARDYAHRFIGGRGIAGRLYWEVMQNSIAAFDSDSHLFIMNGPLSGTRAPAASRGIIVGKSPLAFPEKYACGNLGGHLGVTLKWLGLDGLDIWGASEKPVIMVIEPNGRCFFEDAEGLWGKDTFETIAALQRKFGKKACVAAIGRAGEMLVRFANVICSGGASAAKGFGAVMGSKNLKAIVVNAPKITLNAAQPQSLKKINKEIAALWKGKDSGRYWLELDMMLEGVSRVKSSFCYGCPGTCRRGIYRYNRGEKGHRIGCASAYFYGLAEEAKTGKMAEATFQATQSANRHGLCAMELRALTLWLPKALERGLIDPVATGLNPDELGTSQWLENLINLIINRKGVGDILAEGSRRAAKELNIEELLEGLINKTGFAADTQSPRLFLTLAPLLATEPILPLPQLHEVTVPMLQWMIRLGTEGAMGFLTTEKLRCLAKLFWGDERAAEFDSPDKIGEAAVRIQNRTYAKENFILCDWFWPIHFSANTETGVGDPTLEARLFTAVTGEHMDEDTFLRSGERCANLCRAIYLREGRRGRVDDVIEEINFTLPQGKAIAPFGLFNPENKMPGREGSIFSCTGTLVRRDFFEQIMDDYYKARAWDLETGLFTKEGLTNLDLADLIPELETKGFVKAAC